MQHDFGDLLEIFRRVYSYPRKFWGSESVGGNVRRPHGQLILADLVIEIVHLFSGSSVLLKMAERITMSFCPAQQARTLPAATNAGHQTSV